MNSETPTVTARARKKTPVTPVIAINGRNTTIGVIVEPTSGTVISRKALLDGLQTVLARVAMQHDVLDDDDGIVDHQAYRGGQSAQRHQVEALAQQLEDDESDQHGDGNHQAGDDRGAPVAQEQHHDDRGENQADQDGIAHAVDGFA